MKFGDYTLNRFQSGDIPNLDEITNCNKIYTHSNTLSPTSLTSSSRPLTEDVFLAQHSKIEKLKQTQQLSHSKRKITEDELYANHEKQILFISQSERSNKWEYSIFTTDQTSSQEKPILSKTKWNLSESLTTPTIIRNLLFKSIDEIDYGLANAEINLKITLQGESTCWLFLHSDHDTFIPKTNKELNLNSIAVIQINKLESSQCLYISLGIFLENNEYKVFSRQQLVNTNKGKSNAVYEEEDKMFLKINILDPGNENMQIKINVNNSIFENTIDADYFLPVNDNKIFLIGGSGHTCTVNQFDIISYVKPKYIQEYNILSHKNPFNSSNKNCDCCTIV